MTGGHAATNEAAKWIGHQKIVIKWVEDISSGPFPWCTLVNLSNLLTLCIIFLVYDNVTGLDIFFSREEEIKWAPLYCQYATSDWVYWGEKKNKTKQQHYIFLQEVESYQHGMTRKFSGSCFEVVPLVVMKTWLLLRILFLFFLSICPCALQLTTSNW